jgi:predicted transcriptional regulator
MRKSKLELYEDLLSALVGKYLTVDSLAYACNMDCVAVSQRLDFLIKNKLVEEKKCNKKVMYALTTRGAAINKTLTITKRLDNLKASLRMIDEALQALPTLSEDNAETPSRPRRKKNY